MQHVRRLNWQRELVDAYWRHQLVPLTDSPGSALSFRLAHLSGTNLNHITGGSLPWSKFEAPV